MDGRRKFVDKKNVRIYATISLCILLLKPAGCSSNRSAGSSALLGTGLGALAGQAIGRNTNSTLIGAGVGTGVGYIIGNERDKKAAQSYNYTTRTPLTGTKWRVINLVMEDKPEYESITAEFRPDGILVTTRHEPGGTMTITEERYRIIGITLIINKRDYLINAGYRIDGNEMIVDCEHFRAVLRRM